MVTHSFELLVHLMELWMVYHLVVLQVTQMELRLGVYLVELTVHLREENLVFQLVVQMVS